MNNIATAWRGHEKFASWLVKRKQPSVIVDLGVDFGFSTLTWGLERIGKVYGIDCFQGDPETGIRNTYDHVSKLRKDLNLEDNVELITGYFSDVAKTWDKKIDILHIDGRHLYESVKEDFETWSKFVKDDGVILFHDTHIFHHPFGVHKLFAELDWPKLNFSHSAGLGIITKNAELYEEIKKTFF